jgi:hypothetical protein
MVSERAQMKDVLHVIRILMDVPPPVQERVHAAIMDMPTWEVVPHALLENTSPGSEMEPRQAYVRSLQLVRAVL